MFLKRIAELAVTPAALAGAMLLLILMGASRNVAGDRDSSAWGAPPSTRQDPVVDNYFGVRISDPYRWMERDSDPRFTEWLKRQDAYARRVLDSIPGRSQLLRRLKAHSARGATLRGVTLAGDRVFYLRRTGADHAARLCVREASGAERVLVDPDASRTEGATIDYFEPSPDGAYVAYGVSQYGSERSALHVVEVSSGRRIGKAIDRADYAEPSWRPDGRAFYYNRLRAPVDGESASSRYLNSSVYLHVLGANVDEDAPIIGAARAGSVLLAPSDSPYVIATPGSRHALALIAHGSDPALSIYVGRDAEEFAWRRVAQPSDGVTAAILHDESIYLLTSRHGPRFSIVATPADAPDLAQARTIVPTSERVITSFSAAADALYIADLDSGLGKVRRYDWRTRQISEVMLPLSGAVRGPITDPRRPGALIGLQNWITPEQWHRIDATGALTAAPLAEPWNADTSALLVEELKIASFDGVQVPLSIVRRRGSSLDGSSPAWLTAYGAYGVSVTPSYAGVWGTSRIMPLLEDGGVYAVCHVRGGGEHGEEWRLAGKLERKPNSYKDLIACAEYLIARGYTRPSALALEGASAGAIVASMSMLVRPDLFAVVLNRVGDNNPLRLHRGADGPLVIREFGDQDTPEGFRALLAIDPTQHVRSGARYPAVLLTAAVNDARVAPWQPGKLTAHLQAANPRGRPVILRVDFEGGHVTASGPKNDAEHADMLAFFYYQLGRTDYQPVVR